MFRKFLLFTSCLLTLAPLNGYAAISLDTPKAVLQRGTYSKVTLSFTLSNISAQELATYEMGKAETDDEMSPRCGWIAPPPGLATDRDCATGAECRAVVRNWVAARLARCGLIAGR